MARQLTPFGKVVMMTLKWLIIPLAAAVIGFKLIGPNLSATPDPKNRPEVPSPSVLEPGKKFQSVREGNH